MIVLFGISGGEILLIIFLILILFGPKKIPEIARTLGKGINEVKKVQREINAEIHRYSDEVRTEARAVEKEIENLHKDFEEHQHAAGNETEASETPEHDLPYPYNQAGNEDPSPTDDKHPETR